ncbi:hypothetical protein [Pseudidiomarina insulisalsae]|uniref:Uncharacterized protein n=1 Tax=Pseudidiomarina insulisalsae TaxID=575789 RepID=A0A432YQ39_9GAMM|nr:hypothetical protein [Pseudidiomarina insulisalsae]RUO63515.1 hypothetical protein CWI71_00150 [Pseudidiomarina insulisalsae]
MKLEDILKDPSAAYDKPQDVLDDDNLTHDEKCKVLEQWEYDIRELLVATEENMPGPEGYSLDEVQDVLRKLCDEDGEGNR